ncbi:MAG: hypothetical protein NTX79_01625 [Candidatus Micrarchaeota archaeon]|nr:hypothetical protein [Candidatus Micrarchaeota archaeon]
MENTGTNWKEKSVALSMRSGRLYAASEAFIPFVKVAGQTFYANEKPCVVIAGKKHIVDDVV